MDTHIPKQWQVFWSWIYQNLGRSLLQDYLGWTCEKLFPSTNSLGLISWVHQEGSKYLLLRYLDPPDTRAPQSHLQRYDGCRPHGSPTPSPFHGSKKHTRAHTHTHTHLRSTLHQTGVFTSQDIIGWLSSQGSINICKGANNCKYLRPSMSGIVTYMYPMRMTPM